MTGRLLSNLPGPAVAQTLTQSSIVVVPTGAIEHHGPHLPLATDFYLADDLGSAGVLEAAARGVDVWRLPTLAYTKSDEHDWAVGTVWIGWQTLIDTLVSIGKAVAKTPARTLVFVNGHGGNVAPLGVAMREIRRLTGLHTFLVPALWMDVPAPGEETANEQGFSIHAGAGETSVMMSLHPDLVDLSKATRSVPEALADETLIGFNGKPVQFGWLSNDFPYEHGERSGVIGDPTGATLAYGELLKQHSIERVADALEHIAEFAAAKRAEDARA